MIGLILGIIAAIVVTGLASIVVSGLAYVLGFKDRMLFLITSLSTLLILFLTLCCVKSTVNDSISKVLYESELVGIYKEKLKSLDEGLSEYTKLNPEAGFLVNRDSPITTTIEVKNRLLGDLSRSELTILAEKKFLLSLQMSPFSFLMGDYTISPSGGLVNTTENN